MPPRFLTEPEPDYGHATQVAPSIRRIVAPNPSAFTYRGTNTYLIDNPHGVVVLDPGPEDAAHVAAIVDAAGGAVSRIVFTHTHPDHIGAVAALKAVTGAPVVGYPEPQAGPKPDIAIREGDSIAGMTALHTPGHASDHLCFARGDGVFFSGDHVMSWSTSIVSPPDGDMADYFRSLERLLDRDDRLFLPGHGPPLPDPQRLVGELLEHRRERETAIMRALSDGPLTTAELVDRVYGPVGPAVKPLAERNIIAHLEKLQGERRASKSGDGRWQPA
jgi:glyoxylase-like metal-dependent hydrolase (beta-lactamase superfamily II)